VFVGEVEQEYVVGLAVNVLAYGVGLVGDEGCEYAEMPHARDNVVPIGFA